MIFGSGIVIGMTKSVLIMDLAAFFRGIGFALAAMMIITLMIGNWFVKLRGTLTGIALSFSGIGSAIASPILSCFIQSFGYQTTYLGFIIFITVTILPALLLCPLKPQDIGIHSIRIGNEVGTHEIIISNGNETLTLKHEAENRALFAEGALKAAAFLCGKPAGLYNMKDMLE